MRDSEKTIAVLQEELDELRKAYDELLIKEERYRLLADHTRDVFWTMKIDGTITYLSPAIQEVRGLTVEEAMSQTIDQIHTPESAAKSIGYVQDLYADYVAGLPLKSFRGELDYYRKDGTILHTEVIVYPINGGDLDSLILLGVTRDITERKEFEARLLDQAKQLKELNATKDKFFSIIAHDLRNPFNGILALSDLLAMEVDVLDTESIREYSMLINTSAKQAFGLLEDLLDWANTQQGSFPFYPKQLCINDLIEREIEHIRPVANQKHISFANTTEGNIIIEADENMLETVIRNLLSNATKFTHRFGSVVVKAVETTGKIDIVISDTGVGMNEVTMSNLFKLEKGISNNGTQNEKGSGLGLIISKEFVERHQGTLTVESEIGKGTHFKISLPLNNYRAS